MYCAVVKLTTLTQNRVKEYMKIFLFCLSFLLCNLKVIAFKILLTQSFATHFNAKPRLLISSESIINFCKNSQTFFLVKNCSAFFYTLDVFRFFYPYSLDNQIVSFFGGFSQVPSTIENLKKTSCFNCTILHT